MNSRLGTNAIRGNTAEPAAPAPPLISLLLSALAELAPTPEAPSPRLRRSAAASNTL